MLARIAKLDICIGPLHLMEKNIILLNYMIMVTIRNSRVSKVSPFYSRSVGLS